MTQELKDIFAKPEADWTEDEKSQVKSAVEVFSTEISEVCKKHGLAYKSIIRATEDGINAALKIVVVEDEKENE